VGYCMPMRRDSTSIAAPRSLWGKVATCAAQRCQEGLDDLRMLGRWKGLELVARRDVWGRNSCGVSTTVSVLVSALASSTFSIAN